MHKHANGILQPESTDVSQFLHYVHLEKAEPAARICSLIGNLSSNSLRPLALSAQPFQPLDSRASDAIHRRVPSFPAHYSDCRNL